MFFGGNALPYHDDFLPKTKMVRVVHMNIFYRMDLQFCDPKSELWRKTEILGRWENWKISFEVQNWTSEGVSKDKMTSKHILDYSQVILGMV